MGVITVISILGVTAGVASLIIALAITNGMRIDLQEKLLGSTAHVNLMRIKSDGITHWRELLARLSKEPHVVAAAPALYGEAFASRGARGAGVMVKGILPEYERKVGELLQDVTEGGAGPLAPAEGATPQGAQPPIVLGKDLADSLGVEVGAVVTLISPQGELTPLGILPKYKQFRVVGIFKSGFYEYDNAWALARLADVQKLFDEPPDVVSALEFKVDDLYKADRIGRELERAAGPGFMAQSWMEQNRALFRAMRLEQVVTFIVIALIVCVAALNILISLTMMVMEKTRDIAVLMSMGVRRRQIRNIFIMQGMLISVIGTAAGLAVGYALSWAGGHYRLVALSAEVYSIDYLPFHPRAADGAIVAAVAVGLSLIATLYPSWSAASILPAEALRYE